MKYLFSLLLLTVTFNCIAQEPSAGNIENAIQQAQKSGMSQDQIIQAAKAKGISNQDIEKYKNQQKTKIATRNTTKNTSKGDAKADNSEPEKLNKTGERIANNQLNDETEAARARRIQNEINRFDIFGLDIFNNKNITFEPNLNIAIPKRYILGTGDQLDIDISGYAYAHYTATINADGTIRIENLNPIYLNGLSIEQASEKITQRLKSIFAGIGRAGLRADVTLSKIRSIKVNVIGEAVRPGTYTVPSLATVFNLLYSSGGPTDIGSMRNIEVIRGGRILKRLDLYDYLLKGDLNDNFNLNDQDVIRIPYLETRVEINGEVRNPKKYELKKGETLKNLLEYCGNFSGNAFQKYIRTFRNTETQKKIINVDRNNFGAFYPLNGDMFQVDSLRNNLENVVYLSGAVSKGGWFELESVPTLKRLIVKAEGLSKDAYLGRILIKRKSINDDSEFLQIDYNKVLSGENPDVVLHKLDSVIVKSNNDLRGQRMVIIDGEINEPKALEFVENMTIEDAILLSGGFTDGATGAKVEIARRVYSDSTEISEEKTIDIIHLNIDKSLKPNSSDLKFILKPFDKIFIRKLARYEPQKSISISGEVEYPGPYAMLDKQERITDLIKKSGGLKKYADINSAQFIRRGEIVGINLKKIISNEKDENNLLLVSGDELKIPRKTETVKISGNVFSPSIVPFIKGNSLQDYISMAGGMNDSAFVSKTYVKYSNNLLAKTKSFFGIKIYPKIEPGSEIIVPIHRKTRWTPAERIAVSSAVISVTTVLITIILRVIPTK